MAWPQQERGTGTNAGETARGLIDRAAKGAFDTSAALWARHAHWLGPTLIAGFLACVMLIGWLRPDRNWDMIAYIAAAWQDSYPNAADLHANVFETLRTSVDPVEFEALTTGDAWRVRQATDPLAFVSMIGMYDVKWLYVELMRFVMPFSGPVRAGLVINTFAAALFGAILVWWLAAKRMLNAAPLVVAVLILLGLPSMAIAKTPDMLTTALVLSGFLLLERDRQIAAMTALVASVLVRPDSAAAVGLVMAAAWYWRDRMAGAAAIGFSIAILAYVFASKSGSHPGWWPHLWFSAYHMQETMQGFMPDFSFRVYLAAFAWNIVRSIFENTWLAAYALLGIGWGILHARGFRLSTRTSMLLAAALAAIAAKFAIFPLHDGRTYLPLLIPAALFLLSMRKEKDDYRAGPVER